MTNGQVDYPACVGLVGRERKANPSCPTFEVVADLLARRLKGATHLLREVENCNGGFEPIRC